MLTPPPLIALYSDAPQQGKSTIASYLSKRHAYVVQPLAGPIKRIAAVVLSEMGVPSSALYYAGEKDTVLPDWNVSPRHILQTLGTEWGRTCIAPDIWLRIWARSSAYLPRIVVDDLRFRNEADYLRSKGGIILRVQRPTSGLDPTALSRATAHSSEAGLSGYAFDGTIHNTGTLTELHTAIEAQLSRHAK